MLAAVLYVQAQACNFQGNWTSPPGKGSMRIEITQVLGSSSFSVKYGSQGLEGEGRVDGSTVYFKNKDASYVGISSASGYPSFNTKSPAPGLCVVYLPRPSHPPPLSQHARF